MHSVTGLHIYYYFGHLCDYQAHRMVFEKKPPIQSPGLLLLLEQGRRNEDDYVEHLRKSTQVLSLKEGSMEERAARTLEAMRAGVPVLHNGVLDGGEKSLSLAALYAKQGVEVRFRGETDLLLRVDGKPSNFGDHSYVVADVKSSRTSKLSQMMQVAYYDWLLQAVQGTSVGEGQVIVFPKGPEKPSRVEAFSISSIASMLIMFLEERLPRILSTDGAKLPYQLVSTCRSCLWLDHCEERAASEDNLSRISGLRTSHRDVFSKAGIHTIAALATAQDEALSAAFQSVHLTPEGLARIRPQAIALHKREPVPRSPVGEAVSGWLVENGRRFTNLTDSNWLNVHLNMLSESISGIEFGLAVQIGKHPAQKFVAEEPGQEDLVFYRFLDGMHKVKERSKGRFRLFHFGRWDGDRLLRLAELYRPGEVPFAEELGLHMVDLRAVARRAVYFPEPDPTLGAMVRTVEGFEYPAKSQVSPVKWTLPTNFDQLAAGLDLAGWEPFRIEEAREEIEQAAARIGTPAPRLLGVGEELPGVWYRMHMERKHPLWLTLIDLFQHDALQAVSRVAAWVIDAGSEGAAHVGV
jgi:predicted RecB family nuclease